MKKYICLLGVLFSLSCYAADMPDYDAVGRVKTLNNMGWMHPVIDPVTAQFLASCKTQKILEIGAAYGYASQAALEAGADVWINDIESKHLDIFKQKIKDPKLRKSVHLMPGDFPEKIKVDEDNFDAILAVRVLHFFAPEKLELAAQKMHALLKKGGKVYIVAETPYLKSWQSYLPEYERKKKEKDPYPGFLLNPSQYNQASGKYLPQQLHFLDPDVLTRVFTKAGFKIEFASFLNRTDYPESMRLDGRESVGLIALKA